MKELNAAKQLSTLIEGNQIDEARKFLLELAPKDLEPFKRDRISAARALSLLKNPDIKSISEFRQKFTEEGTKYLTMGVDEVFNQLMQTIQSSSKPEEKKEPETKKKRTLLATAARDTKTEDINAKVSSVISKVSPQKQEEPTEFSFVEPPSEEPTEFVFENPPDEIEKLKEEIANLKAELSRNSKLLEDAIGICIYIALKIGPIKMDKLLEILPEIAQIYKEARNE